MNKQKNELTSDYGKFTQTDNSSIASIINGPNGQRVIEAVEKISAEITAVVIVSMFFGYLPKLNVGNITLAFSRV